LPNHASHATSSTPRVKVDVMRNIISSACVVAVSLCVSCTTTAPLMEIGLTAKDWSFYCDLAGHMINDDAVWKKCGEGHVRPHTFTVDTSRSFSGSTSAERIHEPPTLVDVMVPVEDFGSQAGGGPFVTVQFRHPSGEVRAIWCGNVIQD